ncbi:MAG: tetratricopeptide repeat protein [Myxococcales bacterium]|nr:tetratricopeptide repeat protein [Myxococcales bacterium]
MPRLTLSQYLGMLQEDPDDESAFEGLQAVVASGDPELLGDDPVRLLELARVGHEQRWELRAAAWLIEVELPLVAGDPDLAAALLKELARLRREELLDDRGAREALARAAQLRPGDTELADAIEQIDEAIASWKEVSRRLVEEADAATEPALRLGLLVRAASLVWQHGPRNKKNRDREVDRLFEAALGVDPAHGRTVRLYTETLRQRGRWEDLVRVLLQGAEHARARDERLALRLRAARTLARKLAKADEAAQQYAAVLDLAPGHEEALGFLVAYYTDRQQWDHLVALYEDALRARRRTEGEAGILLQLGMVHWRLRNAPQQAEPYFARLRKLDPLNAAALAFYREQAGRDPNALIGVLAEAMRVAGDARERLALAVEIGRVAQGAEGMAERAVEAWKQVLRLEPRHPEALAALRELYRRTEKWNALVEMLRAELDALAPDAVDRKLELLRELVEVYRDRLGLDAMVVQTYQAIVALRPDDVEALDALAATYERMQRWNDLVGVLQRRAELSTDRDERVALLMRVARLWIDRFANYSQATRPLEEIVTLDPTHRGALAELREIYGKRRAWTQLFDVLRREADLASDPTARLAHLVEMARLAGDRLHRHAEAIALWKQVLELEPATEGALDALEKLAEREKDLATLAQVLERRVADQPDPRERLRLLVRLATLYGPDQLADVERARATWRRVLELDPRNGRALRTLREMAIAAGDWDGLERLHAEARDWEGLVEVLGNAADRATDPSVKIDLSFRAARVYETHLGEPARAFRSYERVLSVDPDNARAARALVPIYEREERWARLVAVLEVLLRSLGEQGDVNERLALLERLGALSAQRLGDRASAFRWAARAYALAPTDVAVLQRLTSAAEAADAHRELAELWNARLREASDAERVDLHRRLAVLLEERLGDVDRAIAHLEAVLQSVPDDADAIAALDRLYRRTQRHDALRALYERRIEQSADPQRRAELLRELAAFEEDVLGQPARALERFEQVRSIDPDDPVALEALQRLYGALNRAGPLVEVLERLRHRVPSDQARRLRLQQASLWAGPLGEPRAALDALGELLRDDPTDAEAIAALEALAAAHPELALDAGRLLEEPYERTGAHGPLVAQLRRRLETTTNPDERRALRLRLAELLAGPLGDVAGAYAELEAAFLDRPTDPELWERLVELAGRAGRYEALAAACSIVLEAGDLDPSSAVQVARRAAALYDGVLGRPDEAEPLHRRVLAADPLDEPSFAALKDLYTSRERWEELQALYRTRIEHTLELEQKRELLLQVCFLFEELLDDPQLAIRAYEEVLELDPLHAPARRALERLYRKAGRWPQLAALLRRELDEGTERDPVEVGLELAAVLEERLGDAQGALVELERVLERDRGHVAARRALARLMARPELRQRCAELLEPLEEAAGDWAALLAVLDVRLEAIRDRLERAAALGRLASLAETRLGDVERAFTAWAEVVRLDPSDRQARAELARLAKIRGSDDARAEALERALAAAEDTSVRAELLEELATLHEVERGDAAAATDAWARLLACDPTDPVIALPAARALERLHVAAGDWSAVAADLRVQADLVTDPDEKRALLERLGELLEHTLGRVEEAIEVHRQRVELDPSDVGALRALATLLERTGQHAALVPVLQAWERAVDDPAEQRRIALLVARTQEGPLGDADSALVVYDDVVRRFGPDPEALAALARLHENAGRWPDLLEVLALERERLEDPVARAEVDFRMGELRRIRTGDRDGALEAYAAVLDVVPEHAGTLEALEALLDADELRHRLAAARLLEPVWRARAEAEPLLRVLTVLAGSDDPRERLRAQRAAIEVAELQLGSADRAFALGAAAVVASAGEPEVADLLAECRRLAGTAGRWAEYAQTLRAVLDELSDADLATALRLELAQIARTQLRDPRLAREHYERVLEERPDAREALDALETLLEELGDAAALLEVLRRKTELATSPAERATWLLRRAKLCEEALGDMDSAIAALEEVLAEAPTEPTAHAGLERLYARAERWHDLASLHERRIELGMGRRADERLALARVALERLDDAPRALEALRVALDEEPGHAGTVQLLESWLERPALRAEAAALLEPVYLRRLDWPRVTATLEARLVDEQDLDRRKAMLHRLAQIHEEYLADVAAAFDAWARLFLEDPRDESTWEPLERLARHAERWDRLATVCATALERIDVDDPTSIRLAARTAALYEERLADAASAASLWRRVLAFDPTDRPAFEALERIYARQGALEPLAALYRARVEQAADDAERVSLLHRLAEVRLEGGDVEAAVDVYRELLDVDGRDARALEQLDRLLVQGERWAELADHLRHRIEVATGDAERHALAVRLAETLVRRMGDETAAVDELERVVEVEPYAPAVRLLEELVLRPTLQARIVRLLEPVYRATDQWKKLIAVLETRVEMELDPYVRAGLLGEIGRLHETRGGRADLAFSAWARAFAIDPRDAEARAHVDRLAAALGAWDALVDAYEQAVAAAEDPALVSDLLGVVARVHDERRGDPRAAIQTFERLLRHDPSDVSALDALEALHTMVGDWRGLVDVFDRKVDRSADPAERGELLRRAGAVLEELVGDAAAAIDAYRRALAEDPSDLVALDSLDRLLTQADDAAALADVLRRRLEVDPDRDARVQHALRLGALCERLGRLDDAVDAYRRVLDEAAGQPQAVDALGRLYERQGNWRDLLDNLRLRAAATEEPHARAALLCRAGEVLEHELGELDAALGLYEEALAVEGRCEPAIQAALRLAAHEDVGPRAAAVVEPVLEVQERFDDLARLVERLGEAASDPRDRAASFRRLARIHEQGRRDPEAAFDAWRRALAEDATDEETAAELERLAAVTGRWAQLADALAERASTALEPAVVRSLYARLARVASGPLGDEARGIEACQRALEVAGEDDALLEMLEALLERTEAWDELAAVIERRIDLAGDETTRCERMLRLAAVRAERLGERRAAVEVLRAIVERAPGERRALEALEALARDESVAAEALDVLESAYRGTGSLDRVATLCELRAQVALDDAERVRLLVEAARLWDGALGQPGRALEPLRRAVVLDPHDATLLGELEGLVDRTGDASALRGLAEAIAPRLDPDRAVELWLRAAGWYRDRLADFGAAEQALRAAIRLDERRVEAHEALVALLAAPLDAQPAPSRSRDRVAAQRALAAVLEPGPRRALVLREAARLAGAIGDDAVALECFEALLAQEPDDREALEALYRAEASAGRTGRAVALLERLVEVETDPIERRAFRHELAHLLGALPDGIDRAAAVYRDLLDQAPDDEAAWSGLEQLLERAGRWVDLDAVLERRVAHATSTAQRNAARRRRAQIAEARLGRPERAVELLQAVVEEDPADAPTWDDLERLLASSGPLEDLVAFLERRAEAAQRLGRAQEALASRLRLAALQRDRLHDEAAAIRTYSRIVETHGEQPEALAALAELHERAGDAAQQCAALERLAAVQAPEQAVRTWLRVARIADERLGDADRTERALLAAHENDPTSAEVRAQLRTLYEKQARYEPLAAMLLVEEAATPDPQQRVALLRAAADLYELRLGQPARAAELLERAAGLLPDDRDVLLRLCDLYVRVGRGTDAVAALERVVASYGNRRVKELAVYLHRLALALEAMGQREAALARMDAAFKIDLTNPVILRDMGRMQLEAGQLEAAQKAYRALLLQKLDPSLGVSKADVYAALGDIEMRRGDRAKAISMLERALGEDARHERARALLAAARGG